MVAQRSASQIGNGKRRGLKRLDRCASDNIHAGMTLPMKLGHSSAVSIRERYISSAISATHCKVVWDAFYYGKFAAQLIFSVV